MKGTIQSYDQVDQRGMVAVDGSDDPLPFTVLHPEVDSYQQGDRVEFEVEETRFGRRAKHVQLADPEASPAGDD